MPTGVCGRDEGLLEITVEGDEFVNEINWNVHDVFGNVVVSNNGQSRNDGGLYTITECIRLNSCYTFSIHDSLEIIEYDEFRGLYTVKFDDKVIVAGHNFRRDETAMFGALCLQDGDSVCSPSNETIPMSMFRLELAAGSGSEIAWNLSNGSNTTISAGPFGDCRVNTLATCLPSQDCYEFTITDDSGDGTCCSYNKGRFTVMFSHMDHIIQNFTGPVLNAQRVFLGTCYEMNFDGQAIIGRVG